MLKLTNEDFLEMIRESTEGFRTENTVKIGFGNWGNKQSSP